MTTLSHAWQPPEATAIFKAADEDFRVDEVLGWECSGDGEHLCLLVRKQGISTLEAAKRLARRAGIAQRHISYAGLKDRHGVCRQWFSLHLPGKTDPDFSGGFGPELLVETQLRNHRKIRRGSHAGNLFSICLRDVRDDRQTLESRLNSIRGHGVPNYFGEQRFGWQGANIPRVTDWFSGRYRPRDRGERSLLLSTARSVIFNAVLSRRVQMGNWNRYLPGDVMNLAGTDSIFNSDANDPALQQRLSDADIHPTGPLWGDGDLRTNADTRALEQSVADEHHLLASGLVKEGVLQARRSLRLIPEQLHYARPEPEQLQLHFFLPPGAYATVVLRELCRYGTREPLETSVS